MVDIQVNFVQKLFIISTGNEFKSINQNCGTGSIDHLELDAQTFADWTVDYLKLDGCYADPSQMDDGYPLMGDYLNK